MFRLPRHLLTLLRSVVSQLTMVAWMRKKSKLTFDFLRSLLLTFFSAVSRYSSVVRTPGKYVPPGARKPSLAGEASPATPEVSTPSEQPSSDAGTPVSAAGQKSTDTLSNEPATAGKKPPQLPPQLQNVTRQPVRGGKDAGTNIDSTLNAFRDYSQKEKERLGNAMRDVHNRDRNNLLNDFKKFSHDFQIKAPIPADLEPILHKTKTSSKPGSATGAVSTSPAPASASPTSAPDTKSPESETKEATSTTEERAATPSSTTEKSKEDKKEFKFNVEAEEFTFNVGAAEFVPVRSFFGFGQDCPLPCFDLIL